LIDLVHITKKILQELNQIKLTIFDWFGQKTKLPYYILIHNSK